MVYYARTWIVLALVLCLTSACNAKRVELKPFSPPDGRFKVLAPAGMAHKSMLTRWAAGTVLLHSYAADHEGVLYVVNYFEIPADVHARLRQEIHGNSPFPGRDDFIKKNGLKIKDLRTARTGRGPDERIAPNDFFVETFKATSANEKQALSVQLWWHENRIYQVIAAHDVVPSYYQLIAAEAFIDSFRAQPDPAVKGR